MSVSDRKSEHRGASDLTFAAYAAFIPIGIATVLLGPMLPTLSARWSLNYSQMGALFTAQYIVSTCAVAVSGVVVSLWGFRLAIKVGLLLMAAGLAFLFAGPKLLGILCIGVYGGGIGLAVPAANLMVAELNPDRRSATLNWLNFCWSAGAVACPFLVAVAAKNQQIPILLEIVAGLAIAIDLAIFLMPTTVAEPAIKVEQQSLIMPLLRSKTGTFLALAALFFVYVGTENGFGGWVASYAKTLGSFSPTISLMTPSFFYAALTFGRLLAPFLLKTVGEVRLVRIGLILACIGTAGLVFSGGLRGVLMSACAAGLGLSYVYPITISLVPKEFGRASSQIGSLMFVLSNIGGGLLPWIVGLLSNHFGSLKVGLLLPILGCSTMFALYLGDWSHSGKQIAN
jgi:fucose permease